MTPLRRLFFPVTERDFTYGRYCTFLDALADDQRFVVVPLCELESLTPPKDRAVVALRHDVDERLDRAADFARLEHARNLRATYFVLHTARYWTDDDLVTTLLLMQDEQGHEIGWHNDLVTAECVHGVDARSFLCTELRRLRSSGIRISGVAAHGAPACYRYGFHNGYFFFPDEPKPGFPNRRLVEGPIGPRTVPRGTLREFGFAYDAYHVDHDHYFSDASFREGGRRWHTEDLDLTVLRPGTKTIVLTHPDHWDASLSQKFLRFSDKIQARLAA